MAPAIASDHFSYVREWNSQFLSLFPHRFDYIYAPLPETSKKPTWKTESRHPLSDRILNQGSDIFGVRFGPETRYCLIDIDINSPYHPQQDAFALTKLLSSLEPLGLTQTILCTSSHSGGLHLFFPFTQPQRSWKLASAVATLLTISGFKLRAGTLEIFPNTKQFIQQGSPSLFNAHRLPLQEPGSQLLNTDLEPIWSSQERFVQLWHHCQRQNNITSLKVQSILRRYRRKRYFVSEKADKFLNDLNAEIEPGWTGKGQTNHLLGRITMRCFIFHHILAGGEPLSGQALVDEIIATAKALPGYKAWCRHQHEITKRATDWSRCIVNSHYFPYGAPHGKYKAKTKSSHTRSDILQNNTQHLVNTQQPNDLTWNQRQAIAAQEKISRAVERLKSTNQFPKSITERFQALAKTGIGGSSLYRYKALWHPKFEKREEAEPSSSQECQSDRLGEATDWHNPTSLLLANGRNSLLGNDSGTFSCEDCVDRGRNLIREQTSSSLRNTNVGSDVTTPSEIIQRIHNELAHVNQQRLWLIASSQENNDKLEQQRAAQQEFTQQLVRYLSSDSPILVTEALNVITQRLELLQHDSVAGAVAAVFQATQQKLLLDSQETECYAHIRALLEVFQRILQLTWSPSQIQAHLHNHFSVQSIQQLSVEQLIEWQTLLDKHSE